MTTVVALLRNAIFDAPRSTPAKHASAIAAAIAGRLAIDVPVVVKAARELAAIVSGNPPSGCTAGRGPHGPDPWAPARHAYVVTSRRRARVYRALLDAQAVATWMVPDGMTSRVHEFDARAGGEFRVSLTYDDPVTSGKTSTHTDTYRGRFVELVHEDVPPGVPPADNETGWRMALDKLAAYIEDTTRPHLPARRRRG